MTAPQLPPHGSISRYRNHKCRCPLCKQTHREYTARNREDRFQRGALTHGTRSAYDAGCRCDDCRRARREAYHRLREYPRQRGESA